MEISSHHFTTIGHWFTFFFFFTAACIPKGNIVLKSSAVMRFDWKCRESQCQSELMHRIPVILNRPIRMWDTSSSPHSQKPGTDKRLCCSQTAHLFNKIWSSKVFKRLCEVCLTVGMFINKCIKMSLTQICWCILSFTRESNMSAFMLE